MRIARIENNQVVSIRDFDHAVYYKFVEANNPRVAGYLPITESKPPAITATQRLVPQYEITKSEVLETWLVEDDPAKVAAAAKMAETNAAIAEVETAFKAWESADEKARGEILHKMLYLTVEALKALGAPVDTIEKPVTK